MFQYPAARGKGVIKTASRQVVGLSQYECQTTVYLRLVFDDMLQHSNRASMQVESHLQKTYDEAIKNYPKVRVVITTITMEDRRD
jgi:hypothetical protein